MSEKYDVVLNMSQPQLDKLNQNIANMLEWKCNQGCFSSPCIHCPDYTGDMNFAWQVADHLHLTVTPGGNYRTWQVWEFYDREYMDPPEAESTSASLAICLAAEKLGFKTFEERVLENK